MFQKLLSLNGHHSFGYPNIVLENLPTNSQDLNPEENLGSNFDEVTYSLPVQKQWENWKRGYAWHGQKSLPPPPPLRPTTPNQLPSLPWPLKNVIKSKGELSGLWNCPWIWKNCKHGLFTCRASTTEQLRMKCILFFVQKKRSRSFEIPHTIQRESKVCMRLIWLLQLVLPEFCRNP